MRSRRHRWDSCGPPAPSPEPLIHREGPHDVVLIKPAGLSVELPTSGPSSRDDVSLLAWVRRRWPHSTPRLPHRLDRMTRGIVVVALTADAAAFHGAALRLRQWTKMYLARVAGRAADLVGSHRVLLRTRGRRAEVVRRGGDPAAMDVVAASPAPGRPGEEHLLIRLHTGRYHQIRATLAHLGAPVAGDPLYDPLASSRERGPFLEHALLRLPRVDVRPDAGSRPVEFETIWRPRDPHREAVDEGIIEALDRIAASPVP